MLQWVCLLFSSKLQCFESTPVLLLCRRNLEDMLRVAWHVAVFDEAHKLKNRSAKIYEACCELKTKLRYGLTGTAMQVCPPASLFFLINAHAALDWATWGGCIEAPGTCS